MQISKSFRLNGAEEGEVRDLVVRQFNDIGALMHRARWSRMSQDTMRAVYRDVRDPGRTFRQAANRNVQHRTEVRDF